MFHPCLSPETFPNLEGVKSLCAETRGAGSDGGTLPRGLKRLRSGHVDLDDPAALHRFDRADSFPGLRVLISIGMERIEDEVALRRIAKLREVPWISKPWSREGRKA